MDSSTLFELRKQAKELEGFAKIRKLLYALETAKKLVLDSPSDTWLQKAYAYLLIDITKYYSHVGNIEAGQVYLQQLLAIELLQPDKIIENQKAYLLPKINIHYALVQKAEELSKAAKHEEAMGIFQHLIAHNALSQLHHEAYGWVIYRYIKDKETELTSIAIRTLLKDYIDLQNPKPSLLHSLVLNFAYYYSKKNENFQLYRFLKLWNPAYLRNEDMRGSYFNDKEIPSLIARILRTFVDTNTSIDIEYLTNNIPLSGHEILELLREPFFWKITKAHKEKNMPALWSLLESYCTTFAGHSGKGKWHSEVLKIAERYMREQEEWRFLVFFERWNPTEFRTQDWEEQRKDDKTYPSLAIKCLKKVFKIIQLQKNTTNIDWLLAAYCNAIRLLPNDDWLVREHALLLYYANQVEEAITSYKKLVLPLGDKAYIWKEFASCLQATDDMDIKIGMLAKAIQVEKEEDFLGDIRLELAACLLQKQLLENCLVELHTYQKHRQQKGWKLSEFFHTMHEKAKHATTALQNNSHLYAQYIPLAEGYAYNGIEYTEVVFIKKWKNIDGKEKLTFASAQGIECNVSAKRFKILKNVAPGNTYSMQLYAQILPTEPSIYYPKLPEYKYIPLTIKKLDMPDWSILDNTYAVIDYINTEKNTLHAITYTNKQVFFPIQKYALQVGDIVEAKQYIKKVKGTTKIELYTIQKIERETGIQHFQTALVVIDSINYAKKLFHYVGEKRIQGIIRFSETEIVPQVGGFLSIHYAYTIDRNSSSKRMYKALAIAETQEIDSSLITTFGGYIQLKSKTYGETEDYEPYNKQNILPDFGFVGNRYVSKSVLAAGGIKYNCNVTLTAVYMERERKYNIIKIQQV